MAFFGFLRCGEFCVANLREANKYLAIDDIFIAPDSSFFTVILKSSKTDPFSQGVEIKIFENSDLHPVHTMTHYLRLRKGLNFVKCKALFVNENGYPMSRILFLQHLRTILTRLGHNQSQYAGHSFRIGAATTAAKVGISDHLIQTLGRWSSDCYTRYIRTDIVTLSSAQRSMSMLS
ncbi:hypothetical protein FSP39_007722 [Pinctada imbricata]|uniref:Tyr recombinase domain-containing protein n=1 Tax=Pinctada imbricata TaxID=66713 RepID=A0AA89BZ17_PINIB|nr:hypothetical protein FSP39_007722 [Pinctada imbricata]